MKSIFLKCALFFLGLLAVFVPVNPARAALVSIDITATISRIDDTNGFLTGHIGVGDIIHGTYIYETTTADTNVLSEVGDYRHTTAPFGITLEVNEYLFRTDPSDVDFLVEICNDHNNNHDAYVLRSYNNLFDISVPSSPEFPAYLDNHISWQLSDFVTHTALASAAGTALPTLPPILPDWPSPYRLDISSQQTFGGTQSFYILADVTSAVLSPTSVPIPAALWLLGSGLIGLIGLRRKFKK